MYPAIIFPVDEDIEVARRDLEIYSCQACSHLFQINVDHNFNEQLYRKYYKYYPYSNAEFFLEPYRQPFENIFKTFIFEKKKGNLLEIGISDHAQLEVFDHFGFDPVGITPEQIEHPRIISSFYESYQFDTQFDVIVSRFNLEHIVDLDAFMSKIWRDLADGGVFIAQVPNTKTYLEENVLNFYVHEHIHYFNKDSLTTLFKKYGFSIEATYAYQSPSLLIVGVKDTKEQQTSIVDFTDKTEQTRKKIQSVLKSCAEEKRKVVFYGAGMSLSGLLYDSKTPVPMENCNIVIFDDNPVVAKKFMPASSISIQPYDRKSISEKDVVILTLNSIYHKRVIEKMRKDGLANDIYCIDKSGFRKSALDPGATK